MSNKDVYENPLVSRNASPEMCTLFSPQRRIVTWRRIWLALAEAQAELGLPIKKTQLDELRRTLDKVDFKAAARHEKKLRHDVMAHLHTWGDIAPKARGILHLGMTSMDVVDNADLVLAREGLELIRDWLVAAVDGLADFAKQWKKQPCLGFTHYQPAQMTTVGRRACLWCYDFVRDLEEIELRLTGLKMRGVRGATGTQASFLALFEGDARKVERLEKLVAKKLGFREVEPVVGQTYSRKVDAQIAAALGNIAVSAHKFANDVRLLAGMKEIEEPFEKSQVGSSAMAYKRNPMRCERMTGLARYALSMMTSPFQNAAEQWLERTLDDSANKRLSTPELFLTVDGILRLVVNVAGGMVVYPKVIESHIAAELPFMATEDILMAATKGSGKTGDRQELHERIRQHSQAAARQVKMEGQENDLMERLANDPAFAGVDLKKTLKADRYIGLSVQQVDAFLKDVARPILSKHRAARKKSAELNV